MNKGRADQVLKLVKDQQQALIDLLQRMVVAESPSSEPEGHLMIRTVLTEALQSVGLEVSELGRNGGGNHIYARPMHRRKHIP